MPAIDRKWVYNQLTANQTDKFVGDTVLRLLTIWESVNVPPEVAEKVVDIFSKLARGESLVEDLPKDEVWVPAVAGSIKITDEVLVKADAFTNDHRDMHNGRRLRVVAIRYGDIVCNSIDGIEPKLTGTHYAPQHLLKLVSP
jgi:hypothetical protein